MTKEQDEVLRKITESNKIADYAMQVLGCDERRSAAFVKVAGDFLKWDGTLQFKTASGSYVAADDPQAKGFFEREFEFLLPPKSATQDVGQPDPATLASAVAGSVTAKGQLFRQLHGAKPKSAEAETRAAVESLINAERTKAAGGDDKDFEDFKRWKASRSNGSANHEKNPWTAAGNTDARGRFTDAAIAKQMSFVRAVGPAKAAQVAAVVDSRLGDLYAAGFKRIA